MAIWRNLTPNDIDSLMRVADAIHPDLPESAQIFAERINLYPEGCLTLETENGQVSGYAISHPIRHHQPPALDTLLGAIPSDADQYYIHDIAILPEFRGCGLAAQCVERLLGFAKRGGFPVTCLVSVYGTERFWAQFGFGSDVVGGDLEGKLSGYGDDAVYLSRLNN
jgi:GNAT superfamily N-acetyltransferase